MKKHYKIANIQEYLTLDQGLHMQKLLNSGYQLEFKSDLERSSIWVLSKELPTNDFEEELKREKKRIKFEEDKIKSFKSSYENVLAEPKDTTLQDLSRGFLYMIFVLIGMFLHYLIG